MTVLVLKDRVKETSTTTGTGPITLLGAETGYQSFSVIGDGNYCYYTIQNTEAGYEGEWEVGLGAFSAPDQLIRNTVFSSSNSGSLVSFSAGTKIAFVTYPAERAVALSAVTEEIPSGSIPFAGASKYLTASEAFQYFINANQAVAPVFYNTNGIAVYSKLVSYNYMIPFNSTAFSYGPIAVANGVSLTIPTGQKWAVFPQI